MSVKHEVAGTSSLREHVQRITAGVHIVVGTVTRIQFFLERQILKWNNVKSLVIYGAHEFMDRGDNDAIFEILRTKNHMVQGIVYTETILEPLELIRKVTISPIKIAMVPSRECICISKNFYICSDNNMMRNEIFMDLCESIQNRKIIIYCNSNNEVEELKLQCNHLQNMIVVICVTDSEISNAVNTLTSCEGSCILITTDIFHNSFYYEYMWRWRIQIFINFSLPSNFDDYVYRVGQVCRFSRRMICINLVLPTEMETMQRLGSYHQTEFTECPNLEDFF